MIAIITYISVLERIKEIGVLRALGARKKDVSRVFNAENLVIGFVSGVVGIGVALLLIIPINRIIENLAEMPNVAKLSAWHSFFLIGISILLAFVAGLIPARIASNKDPVEALRTE
ncbi:MAG: FtsX-like permease family protein, partial [Candidatus Izemoplasmatales bacterium]|nr:FtsX-like permease family protein [Candidatus Izemoplasmatales bacterium]